jgi:hypothetical protein
MVSVPATLIDALGKQPQRTITTEQQKIIADMLLPYKDRPSSSLVLIEAMRGDQESRNYAEQIGKALYAGGWKPQVGKASYDEGHETGLWVCGLDQNTPAAADTIALAFKCAKIDFERDPEVSPWRIVVGHKP